ncbi:hypothetical protein Rsub_05798 [Raphidocelis subcapitata]|uniref:Uncharacterized protein n=1 Tax=Raphidocelis subcapitata TaxID=307507 RepID=A0A2V0P249_9CHLO|nr:hypothetical protein Rsub_05798 [Raphidocelis subcapitata]|eukprot:GBF92962.1 hypothetical protein Rsub_05798 [Raphidocelis subcapitata]
MQWLAGSGDSSKKDPGIITVSSRAASSAGPSDPAAAAAADPLLAHLRALRALVPAVDSRAAAGKGDPLSVWSEIESAKALGADTQELGEALAALLGAYRAWHSEAGGGAGRKRGRTRAVTSNQEYINRCIDQAEAKAAKALRGVRLQLQRLRALNGALSGAAALPGLLAEISDQTVALQARCDALAVAADALAKP